MWSLLNIVVICIFACLVKLSHQVEEIPSYENPIRDASEDEIKNLPGLDDPINFRQFSGYLRADDDKKPTKYLHYWFVESQSNPANAPILLWLNGGPGCSSMGGLFTELGPFTVNNDGKSLSLNNFSWNKEANVLFLDSPSAVGFSYSKKRINIYSDDSTAKENHLALRSFMQKYPQYKNNSLYLSGESYAGVYLPTLGELVDADSELNLKGIAIGNGYLDVSKLTDSLVFFSYHHGLIGESTWKRVSESCCEGKPPTRDSCTFSGKKSKWACAFVVGEVSAILSTSGINPYNLYGPCLKSGSHDGLYSIEDHEKYSKREIVHRSLRALSLNTSLLSDGKPFHIFDNRASSQLGIEPPCFDDHTLINYLNKPEVRKAIHIPKEVQAWDTCSFIIYIMKYPKLSGGLAPQMKQLINSKRNLTMLVYNGDVDTVCNFLGDEWFVDDLGRSVVRDYSIWRVNKQVAGFVKHYDGITFATIRGSGHMVPGDRPQEALQMIKIFLNSNNHTVHLETLK